MILIKFLVMLYEYIEQGLAWSIIRCVSCLLINWLGVGHVASSMVYNGMALPHQRRCHTAS